MLVKMLPHQIADNWEILSYGIQQSLPPITYQSPKRMARILESLLGEKMNLWLGIQDEKIHGIIVTSLVYESNSDVKDLLIYCIYGFKDLPTKLITEGMETLKKFASSKGCKRLTAYSNVESVINMMKRFGSVEYSYLTIPANGDMS